MVRGILKILPGVLAGLFVLYLFIGFVVIPFGLAWGIKDQGSKILKHAVTVKSVQFNPFLWRLSIYGLSVRDSHGLEMVSFGRFSLDVSFLKLLQKEYRLESVDLDGLKVNAELRPGNHINLMDLVPVLPPPAAVKKPDPVSAQAPQPLPIVMVDGVHVRQGNIHFSDKGLAPGFTATLGDINVTVTGFSTMPEGQTRVVVDAKLDQKGTIAIEALLKPLAQPLQLETTFSLNDYAMQVLTPYTGKYTGRALKDGKFDLKMDYRIADNKITAKHKILIQKFTFGDKVESKDALSLPFGLIVGLLEDPQGRINFSLPVTGDMSKPDFHYWQVFGQVARNFFFGLAMKPFSFLASVLGADSGTDELGYVRFLPGQSDIAQAEQEKLKTLIKGLKERPKLHLEVNGSYDPDADWKALRTEAFIQDYKTLRAQSSKADSWVYQMLYQRSFGVRAVWTLIDKFKSKAGVIDEPKLVEEIKRQLIENGSANKVALAALAQKRAKLVYDLIVAEGLPADRLSMGPEHEVQTSMGFVPLEFTLTVFEGTDQK